MEQNEVIEIDLLKITGALIKKAWLIILAAVIAAGGMFGYVKMTYVPSYRATSTLLIKGGTNDVAYTSANAATRIKTYVAFLGTQTVLSEINEAAGLDLTPEAISRMIEAEAINGSEIMAVTATGTSPEKAVQLTDATAETLKKNAEKIHGEDSLVIFEEAFEQTVKENSSKAVWRAVVAAVLAAGLVCALIAVKEIFADWKKSNPKNV